MTTTKAVNTEPDARPHDQMRPVAIECGYLESNPASVLYRSGKTIVLCTASIDASVPGWMEGRGKGWVTAEYNMLPGSTSPRKRRDRSGKVDGRTTEIQRLIGRSLRAVVDLHALGERSITVDCDVLQADGGTRTASITGGFIALTLAIKGLAEESTATDESPVVVENVLPDSVAAVSVGLVADRVVLDLDYQLDSAAQVDMNVVMTGSGRFIEIQGTGEEATFDDDQLSELLKLAKKGIRELTHLQTSAVQSQHDC
ncbi:MAG: ribonuclease PH [Planctomycetota bacterium]